MIYRVLLKDDFEKLPAILREFHSAAGQRSAAGALTIRHQNALLAWLAGFPPEGEDVPVKLEVVSTDKEEIWTRRFGGVKRSSRQWIEGDLLIEAAGPLRIAFQVQACLSGMSFKSRWARVWGIPLPVRVEAVVRGAETCWEVEVTIAHVGSYRGEMKVNQ